MNESSVPSLIKVTEIFLIPSSFLVAAVGTADTNPHRAAVSMLGLIISVLWWVCSRDALAELTPPPSAGPPKRLPRRTVALSWLSVVFVSGWFLSLVIHLALWNQRLGA